MTQPLFEDQQQAWSSPPVDNVGYIPSADLLLYSEEQLYELVENFEEVRYRGERNHDNVWRDMLGLDTTHGRTVLDYGCGVGVEALQYAKTGNEVWVADIAPTNVQLAQRVSYLYGYSVHPLNIVGQPPFITTGILFDVIHCSGVLHHIPQPRPVVQRFAELLKPGGEVRLMLYSDIGWRNYTGSEPPEDITEHPQRALFTRTMDSVGDWADWYNRERLETRFGDLLAVERVEYMTRDHGFLVAILRKKG